MAIEPTTHAPPVLLFTWGSLAFTCVLARAAQRFVMFLPDGTPVRARLKVTFNEYRNVELEAKEVKRETSRLLQAPRRRARARRCRRSPAREYGDPRLWRVIAIANRAAARARPARRAAAAAAATCRTAIPTPGKVLQRRWTAPASPPTSRCCSTAQPVPAELRASIQSVRCKTGYEGLDEVELTLANEKLRWLDIRCSSSTPALTLAARLCARPADAGVRRRGRRARRELPVGRHADVHGHRARPPPQHAAKARRCAGSRSRCRASATCRCPTSPPRASSTLENLMLPIFDPVGAALSIILGGVDAFVAVTDPDSAQKVIRKQANESDYDFLGRIAARERLGHAGRARRAARRPRAALHVVARSPRRPTSRCATAAR